MKTQGNGAEVPSAGRRLVEEIVLFCRATFWLLASCMVVYVLLKSKSAGPALIDIGITLLFTISVIFVFVAVWPRYERSKKLIEMSIKDWISIKVEAKYFALLSAVISSALGIWLAHLESDSVRELSLRDKSNERQVLLEEKRLDAQERLFEGGQKPGYVTDDEWKLALGLRSYQEKDYDKTLSHFSSIKRIDRETDFVRWKFYESMARLRILEHHKFRQLHPIDLKTVREISAAFSELERRFPLDKHSEAILYWHAQLKYQFEGDIKGAQERFAKILATYKFGQWRQGSLFYSAEILARDDQVENLKHAEDLLRVLAERYPTALIRLVEEGVDYRVEEVVIDRLQKVRERIATIEAAPQPAVGSARQ